MVMGEVEWNGRRFLFLSGRLAGGERRLLGMTVIFEIQEIEVTNNDITCVRLVSWLYSFDLFYFEMVWNTGETV